jgi:hypothetical protein
VQILKVMKGLLLLFSLLWFSTGLQANCPGCETALPDNLPTDTIYISAAPDGQVGQYYQEDLSFRMPMTTTPVNANDPDTPPGLPISEITVSSVANLPPGLSWEANQTVFDVSEETDGCVRFCGVPLIPGLYNVEVIISAQVLLVPRTSSFTIPILILPGQSVSEGFTIDNTSGCGEVVANFINNVPSGGVDGFSYIWDFGNGNNSNVENPETQVYDEPGEYGVSYQVIVDTFGYLLRNVTITEASCNDLFGGAPDLLIEVYNPFGDKIYFTDEVSNASLPLSFEPNIFIEDGPYEIRVIDDDQGLDGGDDLCGTFGFVKTSTGVLTDDGAEIEIEILHRVDTLRSEGTVVVFEQPEPPLLEDPSGDILCEKDTLLLLTNYDSGTQWYQDTTPVLNANADSLVVTESGVYWVTYTNADGCSATSDTLSLVFGALPEFPVFTNEDNLLTLFDTAALPVSYSLQWYYNGEPIEGENGFEYCANKSGEYALEVVDLESGCESVYSRSIVYDENFPGCMPISNTNEEVLGSLKVYPTLLQGEPLQVSGSVRSNGVRLMLYNMQGQLIWQLDYTNPGPWLDVRVPTQELPAGGYLLQARDGVEVANFRLVKI